MGSKVPKGLSVRKNKKQSMTPYLTTGVVCLVAYLMYGWLLAPSVVTIGVNPPGGATYVRNVTCMTPPIFHNHHCARIVVDDLFESSDVVALKALAEKGMSVRLALGGPTILDLNTGYLRDTDGLVNLFNDDRYSGLINQADFELYRRIIGKLKSHVESSFGMEEDYISFTAPTFITRLDGRASWNPKELHDEYWHTHADMNNTAHYQYSGLMYLSTYGDDFTGGELSFMSNEDDVTEEELVYPTKGRTVIFTSGPENPHRVARVTSGQRFVLAFWFTRDARKKFDIFLDGKAHKSFKEKNN